MAIYLRQICLVAKKLDPVIHHLCEIFSLKVCYQDHEVGKFGLENSLLAIGSQFIEVVSPTQPNTAAGRFIERRGGDGGYMVICQVATQEEQSQLRTRAEQQDIRIAYESDRHTWNIMQLHPRDMGAAFLEVDWDEQADMTGNWQPAGGTAWQNSVCTDIVKHIHTIELQSDDPLALAQRWATVAGTIVNNSGEYPIVSLANVDLRFVKATDGRGAGLSGVDIVVANTSTVIQRAYALDVDVTNDQITLCGTRFTLIK